MKPRPTSVPLLDQWEPLPGVLKSYIEYWSPTTDAPSVYHIASGLAVLAATVENRIYLPFGGDRLYPNIWALILGPSSFYRKSTCVSKARRTLARLHGGDGPGSLLPDEFSREALLKRLAERAQGLLTYSEFSGALAAFGRDYMSGTKETLADLYDSPESYTRILGTQTWKLNKVCLSILAASQTDWFLEKLKAGDVRGGFLARFTFWPAFEKPRFLAVPAEPNRDIGNRLFMDLNRLRTVTGAVVLGGEVKDIYAKWVERHELELHGNHLISELSPFWSRLSITTLKLAVLLQVSHDFSLRVTPDAIHRAIALTDFLKASLRHLFAEEFAFTEPMRNRQKLLRLIQKHPEGISRRDLMRASSLLAKSFDEVVSTLQQQELVCQCEGRLYPVNSSAESAVVSDRSTDKVRPAITRVK